MYPQYEEVIIEKIPFLENNIHFPRDPRGFRV